MKVRGNSMIEKLSKELFDYTLKYNIYDELMSHWKDEKELYTDIYKDLDKYSGVKAIEQLETDLYSGWEEDTQEYKDIMNLLKKVEAFQVVESAIQHCIDNDEDVNFGYGYIRNCKYLTDDEETIKIIKEDDRVQDVVGILCDESLDIVFIGDFIKKIYERE